MVDHAAARLRVLAAFGALKSGRAEGYEAP
jgi:hypothetical protein